jgi:hypothetical protein
MAGTKQGKTSASRTSVGLVRAVLVAEAGGQCGGIPTLTAKMGTIV